MSLSAGEIAAVVEELQPLAGARLSDVRVHAPRALSLELRGPAGPAELLLSAEADLTRLHAVAARPPRPETPFAFQGLLRRELSGARLRSLEALPGERVVELRFERGGHELRLVAELTGRHGNLFLVDGAGRIRASAVPNLSTRRRLVAGELYLAPAPRPPEEAGGRRFEPAPGAPFPLSAAIDAFYRAREEERALAEARRRLREPVRAALARGRRALERLAEEAERVPEAESDRRAADLLKPALRSLRRGDRESILTEYTADGPREVRVALDPALTPRQNMERYYRHYRRIVESAARVEARAAEVRGRQGELEALLRSIEAADLPRLERLEREARALGAAPRPRPPARRRHREEPAPSYRGFRSLSGSAILVGRGAAENDALTFRVARGNDLWLHLRGRPGAHVVLRLARDRGPDQESLLDAAHLAAHFSDARGDPGPEVAYTRVKHVKRPRGAPPGAVTYSQERSIRLRVEPARLERLLASEEEGELASTLDGPAG
jgi:predicted ribosome quality control (RQC) complex YloA/Tae2 family protein